MGTCSTYASRLDQESVGRVNEKRKRHSIQTSHPKRIHPCIAKCGKKADGTLFNLRDPICSSCFEEFVTFCGVGANSIYLRMTWKQAITAFITRNENGKIEEHAGQKPGKQFRAKRRWSDEARTRVNLQMRSMSKDSCKNICADG